MRITENIDAVGVAREILRALRGRRSQRSLSMRLGYKSNVCSDWEAGRRFPTMERLLDHLDRLGVDVQAGFLKFHAAVPLESREAHHLADWLSRLRGSTPLGQLAQQAGRSRHQVSRWLSGATSMRLHDFGALVDAITGRLPELVATWVPIEQVPHLFERYQAMQATRRLVFDMPWSTGVLVLIETEAYQSLCQHDDQWIAARLGIAAKTVARCVAALCAGGFVVEVKGHLQPGRPLVIDTRADPTANRELKAHWARVAAEQHARGLMSFNVFSVSHEDLGRLEDIQRRAYREMRAVIAASPRDEVAVLMAMHLVPWSPER